MEKPETLAMFNAVFRQFTRCLVGSNSITARLPRRLGWKSSSFSLGVCWLLMLAVVEPLIANHDIQLFLEDAIYPTLLKGLTLLCKNKPANPTEWLGLWLLANDPEKPLVVDLEN